MGVVRKQSFYSSIFVYISMLIGYMNLLLLMPLYFSDVQIGMTRSILTIAIAFAQIAELGSSSIMYRFFPLYRSRNAKDFLSLVSILPLIGFTIFCLVLLLFRDGIFSSYFEKSPELKDHIFLIFYLTFFTLFSSIGTNYCVVLMKTIFPKGINELIPKLGNTFLIVLYAKGIITFDQYFFWFCSLTTLAAIIIWIYIWKLGELHYVTRISQITKRLVKSLVKFGGVAILGTSFAAIISYIDVLMLGGMKGQADVASFSIGYYFIAIMSVPYVSIITVVTPLISSAIRHKRWDEVLRHYRQTSLNNFIIGAFIFGLLLFVFPEMVNILSKNGLFSNALYVVFFLGLGRLIDMITGCNSEIILLSRHYMFNFYSIVIGSILKIILNRLLIAEYGILGVSISALAIFILFNTSRFIFIYYKIGIQPFTKQTLKAILVIGLTFFITYLFLNYVKIDLLHHRYFTAISQILFKSFIWTLFLVPSLLIFRVSPEINSFYSLFKSKTFTLLR